MDVPSWLPTANLILGMVGFMWLLLRTSRRWDEYPTEIRMLLGLTLGLFFGLLAVSVEIVADMLSLNVTIVITTVKVFALVVLWLTRTTKYRTGTRSSTGNPGADQNKDVA
jgi:hypothetical protein